MTETNGVFSDWSVSNRPVDDTNFGTVFLVFIRLCFLDIVHREKPFFLARIVYRDKCASFLFEQRSCMYRTRVVFFSGRLPKIGAIQLRTVIEQTRFFGTVDVYDCLVLLVVACFFVVVLLLYFLLFFASSCAFYRCNFFD